MFFKMIDKNFLVDPDWDASERLSEKEAKLLESLKDNPELLSFSSIVWYQYWKWRIKVKWTLWIEKINSIL